MKKLKIIALFVILVSGSVATAAETCIPEVNCGGGDMECERPNPKNCWGSHLVDVIG